MANSFLASANATIELLESFGLHTKKGFGQHFLVDDNIVGKILDLAEVSSDDTILEVGPGIGTLTVGLLARGARVIAIEKDTDLLQILDATCPRATDSIAESFALLNMDALDLEPAHLQVVADGFPSATLPGKFVANLPYAVAATIVLDFFQRLDCIEMACVMVQSEVAQRMCASPGSKDYGAYTIKIGLLANPISDFPVKPGCFLPPPRVDSRVIRLDRRTDIASRELVDAACMMADAAFFQRRKTIRNSIGSFLGSRGLGSAPLDDILSAAGIDPKSRGEAHPIESYLELGRAFLEFASE